MLNDEFLDELDGAMLSITPGDKVLSEDGSVIADSSKVEFDDLEVLPEGEVMIKAPQMFVKHVPANPSAKEIVVVLAIVAVAVVVMVSLSALM